MNSRPNVLIVILDSARPEFLSCYNGLSAATPNIDRIAGQAYVFEKAISPSAWTFPVMASVFTSMLPEGVAAGRTGVEDALVGKQLADRHQRCFANRLTNCFRLDR